MDYQSFKQSMLNNAAILIQANDSGWVHCREMTASEKANDSCMQYRMSEPLYTTHCASIHSLYVKLSKALDIQSAQVIGFTRDGVHYGRMSEYYAR